MIKGSVYILMRPVIHDSPGKQITTLTYKVSNPLSITYVPAYTSHHEAFEAVISLTATTKDIGEQKKN